MAARFGRLTAAGIMTGTSAKTILQLAAATNHAIRLTEVTIGFHGVVNTAEPIKVEILRQSAGGTSTSLNPVKADSSVSDTLDTAGAKDFSAEPTPGDILHTMTIHPQTGVIYQLHDLAGIIIPASGLVGLRVTAGTSVAADATMAFEE
jgi:hypothetical protein